MEVYFCIQNVLILFVLAWLMIFRIPNIAIGVLFWFISILLLKLSEMCSEVIQMMYDSFPDSLERAHLMQDVDANKFEKFVVCPKCHTVYDPSDLTGISNCSFVSFPRHPQHHMRMKCNAALFKSVHTVSGKIMFIPRKVFCYQMCSVTICMHMFVRKCVIQIWCHFMITI